MVIPDKVTTDYQILNQFFLVCEQLIQLYVTLVGTSACIKKLSLTPSRNLSCHGALSEDARELPHENRGLSVIQNSLFQKSFIHFLTLIR